MGEYIAQHMLAKQVPIGLLLADLRRRQRQAVRCGCAIWGSRTSNSGCWWRWLERQGASLAEILAGLPMDQPTASRVLAALSRRKLVRLDSDPADRRRRRMVLTPRVSNSARAAWSWQRKFAKQRWRISRRKRSPHCGLAPADGGQSDETGPQCAACTGAVHEWAGRTASRAIDSGRRCT